MVVEPRKVKHPVNPIKRDLPVSAGFVLKGLSSSRLNSNQQFAMFKGDNVGCSGICQKLAVQARHFIVIQQSYLNPSQIRNHTHPGSTQDPKYLGPTGFQPLKKCSGKIPG